MESNKNFDSTPSDPPFSQVPEAYTSLNTELTQNDLFKLLVYTKYTSLSRLKLVDDLDFKKEFLILHGAHRTLYDLRSNLLKLSKNKSPLNSLKASSNKNFGELLSSFKKYDSLFKTKADDSCKLKVATDENTTISIDYKSFRRSISSKDMDLTKLDPNDGFTLGYCLDVIKSKYNYDFSTLVSHWNIIYQIFLYNDHEVQVMTKEGKQGEVSHSNHLKLDDSIPNIYELYNNVAKYRTEFKEKLSDSSSISISAASNTDEDKADENQEIDVRGLKSSLPKINNKLFESLVRSVHKTLTNNDILLNIRIFKLNKSSVEEVFASIKPVFKEVLDEILGYECDYINWVSMFKHNYFVSNSPMVDEIYKIFNSVLDFSFKHSLYDLMDLTVDVIFSFSMRNPNFSNLLQCFSKYFSSVLLPSCLKYASELSSTTSDSYNNIWIPSLPNLDCVLGFEYLALQYPVVTHKNETSAVEKTYSMIPKSGTFVIRLDIELLDRIDYTKIYQKNLDSFNFKLVLNSRNKADKPQFVLRSHGNTFFVSDPSTKMINSGSNALCLEILFSDSSIFVYTNGTYFNKIDFADDKLDFYCLELSYTTDNVNINQFYTLTPGFRKFLIKSNLIHHHIFVTNEEFTKISLGRHVSKPAPNDARLVSARSELESLGYIRKVFDYFSFFAMSLSSFHITVANINFNISFDGSYNPLNKNALESLNVMFEILLNLFELISEINLSTDFIMLSQVASVNVITLWRLMSESVISLLSVVEILFSLEIKTEEFPLNFLNNLSKILIESIKYKCTFTLDDEHLEYHHPIDLVSLSNTVNNISIGILSSNSSVFKQLFSTSPIQLLSDILLSIAYSDLHYLSDLTVLAKNKTLDSLNDSRCIEIFTKRALSHVFDNKAEPKADKLTGIGTSNFWWNLISELLESDMSCLYNETGGTFGYCTCNSNLNDLSLLDPMFDYCTFCLRKYFNYFSSITSLNYHMTKLYTSQSFCSIPRPSMLLCRMLLKHGTVILLFNSYCSKYNRFEDIKSKASSHSFESEDSVSDQEFECYYLSLFEPSNIRLIENIFVYLLKMKETILSIMSDRVDVLSKYILDYFGLLLHNFISCLSILDLLSYYSEFMESVSVNNGYLFHLASFTCINLMPYLIKVILLYNKIFKAYSIKYQKFSPFMNYLTVQFSSLFLIFMKFVHYVYTNTEKLKYNDLVEESLLDYKKNSDAKVESNLSALKDRQYVLKFPKCATSCLDFNLTGSRFRKSDADIASNRFGDGEHSVFSSDSEDDSDLESEYYESDKEFKICKSLRKLLILVQDFKYVKGSCLSFKNITEIDSFISKSFADKLGLGGVSDIVYGLLNMDKWALDAVSDYMNPVHPHLVKTQYTLMALFIHLQGSVDVEATDQFDDQNYLNGQNYTHNLYSDAIKYSNLISFRILRKCQAINSIQDIKDKDALRESYLKDVRSRCLWLIRISKQGHYSNQTNAPKSANFTKQFTKSAFSSGDASFENTSETMTNTYNVVDLFKNSMEKSASGLRRSNSSMHLNLEPTVVDDKKLAQDPFKKAMSIGINYQNQNLPGLQDPNKQGEANLDADMDEIIDFILNGPSERECHKKFVMLRMSWLIRLSMLSSVNSLIYSFLDLQYSKGPSTFRHNYRPLILDLILDWPSVNSSIYEDEKKQQTSLLSIKNMNQTLEIFWYILIQKLRSLVLCTLKDSKFEVVNGVRYIPNVYSRVVNNYLSGILENVCDWYIRSGITTIDSTNYTKVNMNFWLEISLSFFSLLYSLGLEPMTDARYSHQIFNHLFTVLHPLPMSDLKQAMSNQTSLSCYTIEAVIVVYISDSFGTNFAETVENLFSCLKIRKFTKKDKIGVEGGSLYLLVRRSSKLPEMFRPDQPTHLKFRHLWSFPKISLTTDGFGKFIIYNFESINTIESLESPSTPSSVNSQGKYGKSGGWVSMLDNDIILWRMENASYLITEVSLTKRTNHNVFLSISSTKEINVFLTLTKNLSSRKTTEIELPLVNYLGGSLQVEGLNGTWSQVVGFTRFDDLYKMRVHLYHLMKYILWVELGTNLYTSGNNGVGDNVGLLLKILFKYLRSTALQIYRLGSSCNCKDKTDNVSIKYTCSNISTGFKYSKDIQGYLVDSDDYMDKPLISRSCSLCSSNLIYKKELDFFWGNILSCLIDLVSFCNNYNLVYLVLHSLLTTFTLGERQVQAFLSMDYLGQRFCNLLVVAIKQLSSTSVATQIPLYPTTNISQARKFGINNFSYLNTLLAAPKIHGVFVLKWLPPLKQVPIECIYATLRENFQSILISKPLRPTTNIEPNDPFVMLPHSEHFVTHRTCADFEADISGNTLQVIRANNMGGIVMYRIPTSLGSSSVQLSTNFYILNASRFGITVAPADCVFGTVTDLFERNDVVGFSHSNSLPFSSQVFAATIGYSLGDILTAHFTIDNQEDGQLCLRTELLIGGNSIGSVLEVVYDPITQNDLSRRMSLVFIFQDPATILLQNTTVSPNVQPSHAPSLPNQHPSTATNPVNEANIINTFLASNLRRDRMSNNTAVDAGPGDGLLSLDTDNLPSARTIGTPLSDRLAGSNSEVVRTLDRLVSRETSGTVRSISVVGGESIPISEGGLSLSSNPEYSNQIKELGEEVDLNSLMDDNSLMFNYENYFSCDTKDCGLGCVETVPAWDAKFDQVEPDTTEEVSLTLCKDEFWDKLLREDKYTCFFGLFSDSVQIYQSVLSVNVPMFSGLKHELVFKVVECFDDLYKILNSNLKYNKLESKVRDCFSWLCVLCCEYDRDVWDKMSSREFKVVSDFSLPFLLGSSFPSRTPLVSLTNELLVQLLNSISKILTVRLVTTSMSVYSTKKGSVRFMHSDVQTDSLILIIGSKCLLASTLILKVLSHRSYKIDLLNTGKNKEAQSPNNSLNQTKYFSNDENNTKLSTDKLGEMVDGLVNFIVYFLSCCGDDLIALTSTTENLSFSKLESILNILGVDVSTLNTQASYKTHKNTLKSVELLQLDELWNNIYNSNPSYDLMDSLVVSLMRKDKDQTDSAMEKMHIKMFATTEKSFHFASRIPSVRRHFMRRSQFYKLIEHDVYEMLQPLVQVFSTYFKSKILNRCTTTLGLFRSSLVHYSSTADSNSLDYWESCTVDYNTQSHKNFETKMDLFSRASDPLYSWQSLFYSCYKNKDEDEKSKLNRVLLTELTYCIVLSIGSVNFVKFLEPVYWMLDTLVRHPLCPYDLRLDLTNKSTMNMLYFLFINGMASPPKMSHLSTRILNNVIPSLSEDEMRQALFLTLYFGSTAFKRVHSVCSFYATSDLDMFTNFDHKRHDHTTRLSTAHILHSFLTSFVLLVEAMNNLLLLDQDELVINNGPLWDVKFYDFYNMGLYLYLARNKKLTKNMLLSMLSLPVQVSTQLMTDTIPYALDKFGIGSYQNASVQNTYNSFRTFGAANYSSQETPKKHSLSSVNESTDSNYPRLRGSTTPVENYSKNQVDTSKDFCEFYYLNCSNRYFGILLSLPVETPTRFMFSQYRDFSKVFAELVVAPTKFLESRPGFYILDEYLMNVPFTRYKLKFDHPCFYRVGYTTTRTFESDVVEHTKDQLHMTENHVYLVSDSSCVEIYICNGYMFWEFGSKVMSMECLSESKSLPFIYITETSQTAESEPNDEPNNETNETIELNFDILIPVNSCFVKAHDETFVTKTVGNGRIVTPPIRTGLSVHNTTISFPNVSLIDVSKSSLVTLNTDILMNLEPDNTLRFDPCLPFRLSFKFEYGFDSDTKSGFYVGLISKSEKLLWYSNGDLYVSTNFHVPAKNGEYRKIKCIPYSETDVISISFDPANSSLYFTSNNTTTKLNFFNYYYHITNVHTNSLINSNKDDHKDQDSNPDSDALTEDEIQPIKDGSKELGKGLKEGETIVGNYSDVNFTCADRRSLINAIIFDDMNKIKKFLDFPCELFENGCDDHFDVEGDDYFLFSPIYIVANLGKISMLKLIATNKNINFDVKSGPFKMTPLMGAVKAGHYNVVYYLITVHSLDINSLDSIGNNCLYYALRASKRYDNDVVELLLNFGVKVQPSGNSKSVLDYLDTIPGDTSLQKRLIDEYKLQSVFMSKPGWPLLQNLQVVMSSKLHVKYNIKIDPPTLSPVPQTSSVSVASPSFMSPDRLIKKSQESDGGHLLEIMGNYLESFGEGVKDSLSNAVDLVTDSFQNITSPTSLPAPLIENEFTEEESMKKMDTEFRSLLRTISDHYNSINSNLSYTRSITRGPSKVAQYVMESAEIIRRDLYKLIAGMDRTGTLAKPVTTEMELSAAEMIVYYLTNFVKAVERAALENKKLKNFILLSNYIIKNAASTKNENELLVKYIRYENELVSFGIVTEELKFSRRLEKNGQMLKDNGVIESFAQNNSNYVYITTNEGLMSDKSNGKQEVVAKSTKRINLRARGSLYTFDSLRQALNQRITFEMDRCMVSLVDLLRNSNKKLATLVKILVFSNECTDVQKYLPPSDSQLWSNVHVTIEHIFNNIYTLKKDVLNLLKTYPLSHIDLQLLHTVLWKSLQNLDMLKNFEVDQNMTVESRLLSILENLDIVPPKSHYSVKKISDSKTNHNNMNYSFNFTGESIDLPSNSQNTLSIRALSSPHLINRVDGNYHITHPTSASRLYQDILDNSIDQLEPNVLHLNNQNRDTRFNLHKSRSFSTPIQNDKSLETNFISNVDGTRNGGSTGVDYIFHCVSLVLISDRLKYYDTLSTIFKNVIPVVSTILNQPKIEYRSELSLISQPPSFYYGADQSVADTNKYSVCLGASMPIHYSCYLNNKPLIKKTTLNEMYDKIFTLKTLSAERPYFSIRVDRGIAHTTQLLKNSLWFQSTSQILNCNPNILRAKNNQRPFMVVFKGEGSTDFGGPFQELLTCISNEFMCPLAPDNNSQTATIKCQNTINNYGMHQDTVLIKFSHYPIHKLFSSLDDVEPIEDDFMNNSAPKTLNDYMNHSISNTWDSASVNEWDVSSSGSVDISSNRSSDNASSKSVSRPPEKDFDDLGDCSTDASDATDKLFTMGCCDLGMCCSSGCCCILPPSPLEDPLNALDLGSSCRCGASELYSEVCNQKIPMELSMYESLGRLCAMCACMMNPLNIAINPIIWKKLLCINLKLIDLLDCDKISVDLLQRLNTLSSTGVVTNEDLDGLVFSLEGCEGSTVDLVDNGSNLPVVPENLNKYIKLSTLFRLTEGDLGCTFLARGINSVIPIGRLRTLLDPRSLEFVVCGDSIVDLSVLRAHTVSYSINLKRDLFDVLARFNNDMLQLFLRFVSGRSRLPHPNSDWCLRLEYDNKNDSDADSRLPTSATCSFRLLMPKYSSLDVMHRRLIYAIENCIAIDLDAHVIHDEMQLSIN